MITTPREKKKTIIGSVNTGTSLIDYRKPMYALFNYLFRYLKRYIHIVMTQVEYNAATIDENIVYVIVANNEISRIYKGSVIIYQS